MESKDSLPNSQVPATLIQSMQQIPLSQNAFNIILPSMSGSSKCFLSISFPHQNPQYASAHICHAHLFPVDLMNKKYDCYY
jgi:hypothetical protein